MIEIRYNTITKEISGICGDETQFKNLKPRHTGDVITYIDSPIPTVSIEAILFDKASDSIIANPGYVPPVSRNLLTEMDQLKARLTQLEKPEII